MSAMTTRLLLFCFLGFAAARVLVYQNVPKDENVEEYLVKAEGAGSQANHSVKKEKRARIQAPHRFARSAPPKLDGSEKEASKYIATLKKSIQSGNSSEIAALLSDKFVFKSCKGDYNKATVLTLLSDFSKNTKISLTVQSSKWIKKGSEIEFTTLLENFVGVPVKANVVIVIEKKKYVLIKVTLPKIACSKGKLF